MWAPCVGIPCRIKIWRRGCRCYHVVRTARQTSPPIFGSLPVPGPCLLHPTTYPLVVQAASVDPEAPQSIFKSEFITVVELWAGLRPRILDSNRPEIPMGPDYNPLQAIMATSLFRRLCLRTHWRQSKMLVSSVTILRLVCPMSRREPTTDHVSFDASAPFPFLRIDLQTYGDQRDSSFNPG